MIYTVECSYFDSASEEEWNDFYSLHKLPALISVRGFHTSQRFRACGAGCPTYLALHSIDGLEVLHGDEYARKGGATSHAGSITSPTGIATYTVAWIGPPPSNRVITCW